MVRGLLDIEEIKRLKAGYFRCLDRKEWTSDAGNSRIGLQGYGHSIEEYVREDGAW